MVSQYILFGRFYPPYKFIETIDQTPGPSGREGEGTCFSTPLLFIIGFNKLSSFNPSPPQFGNVHHGGGAQNPPPPAFLGLRESRSCKFQKKNEVSR